MTVIRIDDFSGGISPRVPAPVLPPSRAQTALDVAPWRGSALVPLSGVSANLFALAAGTKKTIYRFGVDTISDTNYWFQFADDTDVTRGPVSDDPLERTYYTASTHEPRVTDNTLALSSSPYPGAYYTLGVPAPVSACTAAVAGAPTAGALTTDTVYIYTYVNSYGEESAPSPASNTVSPDTTQSVNLSVIAAPPAGAYNITHVRIYRAVAGTSSTNYLFVAEIASGVAAFSDTVTAANLGGSCPSITWTMPPSGLVGLTPMANGMMAGFVGKSVYFCDPYHPFTYPIQYMQTVDSTIVGLGAIDTTLVVLTNKIPYFMQGSSPDAMTVVKADVVQACVSKRSIVSANQAVFYAAPDGLVMCTPAGSRIVTLELFTRDQWNTTFNPSSIHGHYHDNKYIGFYDTGSAQGSFVYDMITGAFSTSSVYCDAAYTDLLTDILYLNVSNEIVKWEGGAAKTYTYKSKKFTTPQVTSFSCAQLIASDYPVTVDFYKDGTLEHTAVVESIDVFRLPDWIGNQWEIGLSGTAEVYSFAMAESPLELTMGA